MLEQYQLEEAATEAEWLTRFVSWYALRYNAAGHKKTILRKREVVASDYDTGTWVLAEAAMSTIKEQFPAEYKKWQDGLYDPNAINTKSVSQFPYSQPVITG